MTHWKFLAAASLLATPLAAQPVTETEDEVVTVDEDGQKTIKRTVVKKIDQDGHETVEKYDLADRNAIEREKAERMTSDCPGRLFATKVEMTNESGNKQSREIKLCGESDDPAKWVTLLESAKEQVLRMDTIDAAAKASLLDDLDAEIARTQAEADDG